MDDLEHRRALVAGAGLAGEDRHTGRTGREVAERLAGGQIRHAVRQHADFHAGSVNVERATGGERPVRHVALRAPAPLTCAD